jgi:hypothetical protein
MMSTCCSKQVEAWNKYIKKECVKLVINQNYVEMHGQQNIKWQYAVYMDVLEGFWSQEVTDKNSLICQRSDKHT